MRALVLVGCAVVALAGCSVSEPTPPPVQSQLVMPIEADTDEPAAPVSLTLPLGDEAPIEAVATDDAGVLHPPVDVTRLGWWVDSALPGTPGTVVVTGHINANDQGPGFAGQFIELDPGDRVELETADGDVESYVVREVVNYSKAEQFPAEQLNSLQGQEVLALITCGGEFVGPPFGYEDNVIAWAIPA